MTSSLIRGKYLICKVDDRTSAQVFEDGAVFQRDGVIVDIGKYDELASKYNADETIGSARHIVLPGFVNSHHHVGLTPVQLGSHDVALEMWFATRIVARDIDYYLDTLYSAFEMIESGITTVQHLHGWMPGGAQALETAAGNILRAYDDIGMRVSYAHLARDQNHLVYMDDDEFVAGLPADLQRDTAAYLTANSLPVKEHFDVFEDLHRRHHGQERVRVQLAPANLHWCSDRLLEMLGDYAERYAVPMHMHLLETAYQKEYARRRTGTTAVQHLREVGLLGSELTLGHGVWLNESDIDSIAESGTRICHNCSSNFRLRSGLAPLNVMEARGVRVGIGLDEAGINDDRDMLQEMRMVFMAHREPGMDDSVPTAEQVLRMATEHGAHTTPFKDRIGTLEIGKAADMVVMNWEDVTYPYMDALMPVLYTLLHRARTTAIETVLVAGEPILRDGKFTRVDKDAALAELAESLQKPLRPEEQHRRVLSERLCPHVHEFYKDYLAEQTRTPFYRPSSRH